MPQWGDEVIVPARVDGCLFLEKRYSDIPATARPLGDACLPVDG